MDLSKTVKNKNLSKLTNEELISNLITLEAMTFHLWKGGPEKCPFMLNWLEDKLKKTWEIPKKPIKTGIPKGDLIPLPRSKEIFTLLKSFNPQLKLKPFADTYHTPYGTVANWNIESALLEAVELVQIEFALDYIEELKKLVFSSEKDIFKHSFKTTDKATRKELQHMMEAEYYHHIIYATICYLLEAEKKHLSDEDKRFNWEILIYNFLRMSDERDIYNPPKSQKEKRQFEKSLMNEGLITVKFTESYFSQLKNLINDGDTETALKLIDILEAGYIFDIKHKTDLKISILNKGKRGTEGLLQDGRP